MAQSAFLFLVLTITSLGLGSCQASTPDLVQVFDLFPPEVETHDTLSVRGAGFPPGETATLLLEGALAHAGSGSRSLEIEVEGQSVSDDRVELSIDERLVESMTSADDGPAHATFRGTATLSFAPNREGAPPIRGSANVVLDVFPSRTDDAPDKTDNALSEFLGVELERSTNGLVVKSLVPDGRMAQAGIRQGDRIVAFSDVRVHTQGDLLPHAGQRWAKLEAQSANSPNDVTVLALNVEGFRPQRAQHFKWGLSCLFALAVTLLFTQTRVSSCVGWIQTRLLHKTREPETWLLLRGKRSKERFPPGFGAFLLASAAFSGLHLNVFPSFADLGLAIFFGSIATLNLLAALFGGGYDGRSWSPLRGLAATFRSLTLQLGVAFALFSLVLERGSLGLGTLAHHQSASPAEFLLFSSPSSYLAALALMVAAICQSVGFASSQRRKRPLVVQFGSGLQLTSSLLLVGLIVALFLGGFSMPAWIGSGRLAAAAFFELKFTLAFVVVLAFRRAFEGVGNRHLGLLPTRFVLPAAFLAVVLVPVWLAEVWPDWMRDSVRVALQLGTLLSLAAATHSLFVSSRKSVSTTVNPWL